MTNYKIYILGLLLCGAIVCFGCCLSGSKIVAGKLVTKADAEKIFGVPMRLKSEETSERESTCVYSDVDADLPVYLQASFQTFPDAESLTDAEEMMKAVKAKYKYKIETVEGVGDAAWLESSDIFQTLHVRRNNVAFLINAEGGSDREAVLAEMLRIAKAVAAAL